jgi:uncharacterized protein YndB with AHSA1/START domain
MTKKDYEPGPLAEISREIGDGEATLVFTRSLKHSPRKIWRAITQPKEQIEWMPFVSDRDLTATGPCTLRMTDREDAPEFPGEVLKSVPEKLLSYRWREDLLDWELAPTDGGTRLTLRHLTKTPENTSSFAAGWHICIGVLDRLLEGRPVGPIIGAEAMNYGWAALNDAYAKTLNR